MEQYTLTAIASVTSIISATGGFYAAFTAYRSAGIAKDAAKHAYEVDRRSLLREVSVSANMVVSESIRVEDIANKLKQSYRTLAGFSGQMGGSRQTLLIDGVKKKQREVHPLQQEAIRNLENRGVFRDYGEEELSQLLIKVEGDLLHVRRVKEKFLYDLESVELDIKLYRENMNR